MSVGSPLTRIGKRRVRDTEVTDSLTRVTRIEGRVRHLMQATGAAVFGLGLWSLTALVVREIRHVPFPDPVDCLTALMRLLGGIQFLDHTIYDHVLSSCGRWLEGSILAFGAGFLYAFAAFRLSWFRRISMPTVEVLQIIPGLAWIPVVILLFGLGSTATVAIIALTTFPIVAIASDMGFASADADLVRVGRMCGYGTFGLLRTVYVPGALPHLLSGTRIALGNSWRVLVAAEMVVGSGEGLGYAIIQSRWTMDYEASFACIIIIAAIGMTLERLILQPLERRTLRRWRIHDEF